MNRILTIMTIFLCLIMAQAALAVPPVNDNCVDATDAGTLVSGVAVPLTGTTSEATMDCSNLGAPEVWVKFTISNWMNVTIDFCSQSGTVRSLPGVIFGECPCGSSVTYQGTGACTNRNPLRTWNGLTPGTYYYGITNTTVAGAYTINITGVSIPPPANDNCSSAIAVGEVTNQSFNTRGAVFDGEGTCITGPNIWYIYTPTFSGTARVALTGSGFSPKFAVYNGASCSPLPAQIGCTEQPSLDFQVVSGSQYLIEIGGVSGAAGSGTLTITSVGVIPPNDNCVDATDAGTLVSDVAVQLTGTTTEATMDCSSLASPEVWVKFTVPTWMNVTIDFCGQASQVRIIPNKIFSECPCGSSTNYSRTGSCPNHNPSATWSSLPSGTYYYGITTAAVTGQYTLNMTGVTIPAPINNNCADETEIGEVTNLGFSTIAATFDGAGTCISSPNIWYIYTPTFSGTARISLTGSTYSTKFAVYNGASCSPLPAQIACTEETSLEFPVAIGAPYLIEIGGVDGASGAGNLTISAVTITPPNDNCVDADDAGTLVSGAPVQLSGTTVGSTRDCNLNVYAEVWTKFTVNACMNVTIDFCDDTTLTGMQSIMLFLDCGCRQTITANRTASCPNDKASFKWFNLAAGTYYYPILTNSNIGEPYIVNFTGVDCPPAPEPDFSITAPYSGTNTTCGAGDDCYMTDLGEDHIYEVTIPSSGNWKFSLCNSASSFESALSLGTSVCDNDLGRATSGCANGHANLKIFNLTAGTYYLTLDGRTQDCGEYTLDISLIPDPCDGSYYANGPFDNNSGINDYRCDEADSYAADDFTLTEDVTIDSIKFTFGELDNIFNFNNTGDYQILSNDNGAPGSILFEGIGVSCTRVEAEQKYHNIDTYVYQIGGIGAQLDAGTYFLACRPVVSGNCMGEHWWVTTGSQSGSLAYHRSSTYPTWAISDINSDLAYCIFATVQPPPQYVYEMGDVNNSGTFNGIDVTYGVGYFKGGNPPPYSAECNGSTWFVAGDVNGNCSFNGIDITYMVSYFKGGPSPVPCPDCPPSTIAKK